jgi:hypothetical protein
MEEGCGSMKEWNSDGGFSGREGLGMFCYGMVFEVNLAGIHFSAVPSTGNLID